MNIDFYTVRHNMLEKHLTDIRFAEKWPRVNVHFNSSCLPRPSLIHPTAPSRDFDWRSWLTSPEFGWETRATKRCFEWKCSSCLWAIWGVASRVGEWSNTLQKLSFKAWRLKERNQHFFLIQQVSWEFPSSEKSQKHLALLQEKMSVEIVMTFEDLWVH